MHIIENANNTFILCPSVSLPPWTKLPVHPPQSIRYRAGGQLPFPWLFHADCSSSWQFDDNYGNLVMKRDINPLRKNNLKDPYWENVIKHWFRGHMLFLLPRGNCIFLSRS